MKSSGDSIKHYITAFLSIFRAMLQYNFFLPAGQSRQKHLHFYFYCIECFQPDHFDKFSFHWNLQWVKIIYFENLFGFYGFIDFFFFFLYFITFLLYLLVIIGIELMFCKKKNTSKFAYNISALYNIGTWIELLTKPWPTTAETPASI